MLATCMAIEEIKRITVAIIDKDDVEIRKQLFNQLIKVLYGEVLNEEYLHKYFSFKDYKEINARVFFLYSLAKIANEYIEIGGIFAKVSYKGLSYSGIEYGKLFWMPSQSLEGKEISGYKSLGEISENEFLRAFARNAKTILFN